MFQLIASKFRRILSQGQIFFNNLVENIQEFFHFVFFIIKFPFISIYHARQALYSFIYIARRAPSDATFALLRHLLSRKKNAYELARAICRYREIVGNTHNHLDDELLSFIKTPQNTHPYESVELAEHFMIAQSARRRLNSSAKKSFFELASKACCWGVAQPYRQAVDHLLATRSYSDEIGLRLLSLDPDEMVPYAQQIASGGQALTHDYSNIGAMLPPEQTPHSFRTLLDRIINENDNVCRKIEVDMKKILHFFHTHPEHLSWANEIASQALSGCVNQPLMAWLEICAWVHIAKQPTIIKKLEAANFLQAFSHVKLIIANHFSDIQSYYPEYICALMQSLYYKLCSEQVITEPWIGICDKLWERYRQALQANHYVMFKQEKICAAVIHMTKDDAIDTVFMQSAGRAFWARIAVPQEELRSFSAEHQKEKHYLRQVILYLTGSALSDIDVDIHEQGYTSQEFHAFLEQKCPDHGNKTSEQKLEAALPLIQEHRNLSQSEEISVNQQALLWTKRQATVQMPGHTNSNRFRFPSL